MPSFLDPCKAYRGWFIWASLHPVCLVVILLASRSEGSPCFKRWRSTRAKNVGQCIFQVLGCLILAQQLWVVLDQDVPVTDNSTVRHIWISARLRVGSHEFLHVNACKLDT